MLSSGLFVALGYLLVTIPWFIRNLSVAGTLLSPGGTKTLWLTNYDDLYCYGCDLSPASFFDWGWRSILSSKLSVMGVNLQRFLAENCQVFMLPLAAIGYYRLRRRRPFVLSLAFLLLVYLAHSLAFTFPGVRGGFFHASSPVLPFIYAAAVEGLDAAVKWLGQRRRWNVQQAGLVFTVAMAVAAMGLSYYIASAVLPRWQGVERAGLSRWG